MLFIRLICLIEAQALTQLREENTMGRRNKDYSNSLREQAHRKLTSMLHIGESKAEAKKNGSIQDKIFSWNTFKTYWKHTKYFISYLDKNHPGCKTLKKARKYVPEWLKEREEQGLSAWTIQTEAKALNKLFQIDPSDKDYYDPPKRRRADIKRSRLPATRDKHFSEANNYEFVCFCKGTGPRRCEARKIKGKDLYSRERIIKELDDEPFLTSRADALRDALLFENEYFLHLVGKGGRERFSPVLEKYADLIITRMKATLPESKVWLCVPSNADIHSYRSEYATSIYKKYARNIEDIPRGVINPESGRIHDSELYKCRKEDKGKMMDKKAMLMASKALGHNRIEIVANNYIRGL